jgi:hypothetical protein
MFRNILTVASAGAALIVASPLLAQAHGGHGGGPPAGSNGRGPGMSMPDMSTTTQTGTNYNQNSPALQNSQGPANASPTGISHANQNSVLARGAVSGTSTSLSGLTTGQTVQNSTGTSVGTVSQVITGSDGSIRAVVVTGTNGQTYRLPPSSLSVSGGVVTTTSTSIGG